MNLDIKKYLPHRFPFLLVDKIVFQKDDDFECLKNVSNNESFFEGHFPDEPVMPGVLIIEALAQASAIGLSLREGKEDVGTGYFVAMDKVKFKRKVVPGDQLRLTGTILMFRRGLCKVQTVAYVEDEIAAEALISFIYK